MRFPLLAVILISAIVALSGAPSHTLNAELRERAITEQDLFQFIWIANPQISPDGTRVTFTRVNVDKDRTGYETSIWAVDATGDSAPFRMTRGNHDSQPRWSPNGKYIAFTRGATRDESGNSSPTQIAILPLAGGEARIITHLPQGAWYPVWSPDSRHIAFLSSTATEDTEKLHANGRLNSSEFNGTQSNTNNPQQGNEHHSDVHIISRATYRRDGVGYLDPKRHQHIWVVDLPNTSDDLYEPKQVTRGDFDEREPVWSRDNSRLYFLTQRLREPYYYAPSTDIYSVLAAGGTPEKLATVPMEIKDLAPSPDGRKLAFHGSVTQPVRSYSQPDLWVMDINLNASPRNLTADYDYDMGSSLYGDNTAPRGGEVHPLDWSTDSRWLLDSVSRRGGMFLVRVDAQSGALTDVTKGNQAILDFCMAQKDNTIVALVSTPTMIGDLFTIAKDGAQTRITDVNRQLWSQLKLTAPEEIEYKSFDSMPIQGWIQKPPDFDPTKKYPLILDIHGGPHAAYGWIFEHEFQWLAARGYVVLYVNPRGSTTYGQHFGNITQYRYPGDDYRDLMVGVDEVLKRGFVDSKKLAVTGGSGGGVLTDWTIAHTDRFAAAVSQRDISNWASWWYTTDLALFQPEWFKSPPFEAPQDYAELSAITFVKDIHTPVMFVLGESDLLAPQGSGGEQIFRALKFLRRPTVMVVFPRETHELSRSGEPWHRIERLDHIVGWFDKWLMGVPHPEYEIDR